MPNIHPDGAVQSPAAYRPGPPSALCLRHTGEAAVPCHPRARQLDSPALPALDSPALPGLSSLVRYDMPLNHGVVAAVQLLFRHAAEGVDDYLQPENQLKAARAMFVDQVHPSPATQDAPGPRTPALLSPSLNLRLWPSLLPLCAASPGETAPLPVLFSCARFHTTRRLLSGQAGAAGGRRVRGQQQHYDRGGGRGALAGCQRQALITHSAAHTHTRAMI